MTNLLANGVARLHELRKSHMSSSVVYKRGADEVTVSATVGQTTFEHEDEDGFVTEVVSRDFIVTAADLVLAGSAVEPARGDTVEETVGGTVFVHEVLPYGAEPEWRWSDPHHTAYRVHTKQIRTEDA